MPESAPPRRAPVRATCSQRFHATPPGLQRVVKRCLEKNPEQRFQSASDLVFALEALSDSSDPVSSSPAVSRQTPRNSPRLALWIGGAAVLVTIGYLVLNGRSRAPNLRVTEYSQVTHSGNAGQIIGTDGVSFYLDSAIWDPVGRVAITGGEIESFTKLPPRSELHGISPDGTTLLYLVYRIEVGATAPLYSLKVLGGSPRYLGTASGAAWSPDGNSILYDADGDIFQMSGDGTNRHKLISTGGALASYRMSPDG
jgi:eukaryotic-like serine/threonine-protein kinase